VTSAILTLEDGRTFHGEAYGCIGETVGEAVFSTGMTGYQETLTDPSYHGQVVVMTAPHIGNTGVNDEDGESARIWVAGYVVRDPARVSSSWRARRTLTEELSAQGVVGISGIDTRALTRHLRERGAMRVGISSTQTDAERLLERVLAAPPMTGSALAEQVSTTTPYVVPAVGDTNYRVTAVDLGVKTMTLRRFAEHGVEVVVLPASSTIDDVLATEPDGVFFSNGPGDPATAAHQVDVIRDLLWRRMPFFGICFGHQLLGRALGLPTYKLRYGHRGINQPVKDLTTGRVEVTSHNHGFAVGLPGRERVDSAVGLPGGLSDRFDTDFGPAMVTHRSLNDNVVEGLALVDHPAFSVQYHPEAAAGPHDAGYLFARFCSLMSGAKLPLPSAGFPSQHGSGGVTDA
jgi:carbamoyl-phosphate synthase small subunit